MSDKRLSAFMRASKLEAQAQKLGVGKISSALNFGLSMPQITQWNEMQSKIQQTHDMMYAIPPSALQESIELSRASAEYIALARQFNEDFNRLGSVLNAAIIEQYNSINAAIYPMQEYLITHKTLVTTLAESMLAVTALSIPKFDFQLNPLADVTMGLTQIAIDRWLAPFEEFALTIQEGTKRLLEDYRNQINPILYQAKWFPYMLIVTPHPAKFMNSKNNIVKTSKGISNNMVKRLDKCVFDAFRDTHISDIRKGWRDNNIDKPILRTMNQALAAYHRKEYAITSIVLSSLWEGIIADKKGQAGYRLQGKIKEHFKNLVSENELPQVYTAFFDNYIQYTCTSKDAVIDDVPGRNSNQHGWMKNYPSKKAALNAILFTDFLLALEYSENIEVAS